MKYEVEDGVLPNARSVRFGYDPRQFPDFSWRGYAVMSPAQVSSPAEWLRLSISTLRKLSCRLLFLTSDGSRLHRELIRFLFWSVLIASCFPPLRSHLSAHNLHAGVGPRAAAVLTA